MIAIAPDTWRYWLHHPAALVGMLKWPISFVAGWSAIYIRRWQKRRDEANAQGWPSIEGRIISSQAARVQNTTRFMVTLEYSFFLDAYHYGTYVHEFSKESEANEFARQLKDNRVQIRYNQSNPDKSVLEQSVLEQHILLAPRFG
jgi:hypothetical protein